MGAALDRVHILPLEDEKDVEKDIVDHSCASDKASFASEIAYNRTRKAFKELRVQNAECFSADKQILFGAIETGFSSLEEFNQVLTASLLRAIDQRSSSQADPPFMDHSHNDAAKSRARSNNDPPTSTSFLKRLATRKGGAVTTGMGKPVVV